MLRDGLAIDLGTVNTLIARRGRGILLNEASAVAVNAYACDEILAVGNEAIEMRGRTPNGVNVRYPLQDGVIADYMLAEAMVRKFIRRVTANSLGILNTRAVLTVPNCITPVERAAIEDAAHRAGIRETYVLNEAMAAGIGAGLAFDEPMGSMIVDIGGGTTDAAVVTLSGIAAIRSIRTGGTHIDEGIISHVRREFGVCIGMRTAEQIKLSIGNLNDDCSDEISVRGLSLYTGLPQAVTIGADEVKKAISRPIGLILNAISDVLADTPPELAGDIIKSGITLTGGGAQLVGLPEAVHRATGIRTRVADNPLECVVAGAFAVLNGITERKIDFDRESGLMLKRVERLA